MMQSISGTAKEDGEGRSGKKLMTDGGLTVV
jgi:hypothetical protein